MSMSPRLLRPGGVFTPRSITGLQVWLDPSDASAVTLNSTTISAIADKSGNGRTFFNSTSVSQPTASTLNGRTAASIDASSKWLQCEFSITYTAQTVVVVANADAANPAFSRLYSQANASSETPAGGFIPLIRNASQQMTSYTNQFFGAVAFSLSTTSVFSVRHTGSSFALRVNGTAGSSQSHSLNYAVTRSRYGNGFSGSDGFRGLLGDCLVWNRSLSDLELLAVERWAARRWGASLA
jgi:hypothetical protein